MEEIVRRMGTYFTDSETRNEKRNKREGGACVIV